MIPTEKFCSTPELEAWLKQHLLPAVHVLCEMDTIGDLDGLTEVYPRDPDDFCRHCGASPGNETSLIDHEPGCLGVGIHQLVDDWERDRCAPDLFTRAVKLLEKVATDPPSLGCLVLPECVPTGEGWRPCESCPHAMAGSIVRQCAHLGGRR